MMVFRALLFFVCAGSLALSQEALTNDTIVKMVKAGLAETVILSMVSQQPGNYSTNVDDLIALKQAGVSDKVVSAMAAKAVGGASAADTKMELGVYAKKEGAWIALEPELVSIKQSSAFRMYTGGVDTNGYIGGASSKTTLKTPLEIMLVTAEGVSASEYQLVRLRPSNKNNTREFRVGRFGFGGGKSGVDRDKVTFDFKKLAPRQFTINLPSSVVAGEYAFLPPMATGGGSFGGPLASGGKAFTFRVLE